MSEYQPEIKLLAADWHRNGIGGAGFYVAIFEDLETKEYIDGSPMRGHRFLAIYFAEHTCPKCNGSGKQYPDLPNDCPHCCGKGEVFPGPTDKVAVLELDEAAKGNIYMFPEIDKNLEQVEDTGDNAWRGADYYGKQLAEAIAAQQEEQQKLVEARLKKQLDARKAAQKEKENDA